MNKYSEANDWLDQQKVMDYVNYTVPVRKNLLYIYIFIAIIVIALLYLGITIWNDPIMWKLMDVID